MNKLIAALFVSQTSAADWNYLKNGRDWGTGCTDGQTNQTPINLLTESNPSFSRYPKVTGVQDFQSYLNQYGREVKFNGHSSQIDLADPAPG